MEEGRIIPEVSRDKKCNERTLNAIKKKKVCGIPR